MVIVLGDCISHRYLGSYRVYIKYFLTKIKLSTCSDMLLNPNSFRCDILSFCSESLLMEKHPRYSISKFWLR